VLRLFGAAPATKTEAPTRIGDLNVLAGRRALAANDGLYQVARAAALSRGGSEQMLRAGTITVLALVAATSLSLATQGLTPALFLAQVRAPTDPAAVLQRFQDAVNDGDVDAAMRLVSPDIAYAGDSACPDQDPCVGTRTFRRALEVSIANQVHTTMVGRAQVAGTTVRVSTLTTSPGRTAIGVDHTSAEVTASVVDGTILSFRSEPDRDDAQTLWWLDHNSAAHGRSLSAPPAGRGGAVISYAPPVSLVVTRLEIDTYFDRGRGLVILTNGCNDAGPVDTDALLRAAADSAEPELAFPFGLDCPVTFISADNAYLASAEQNAYRDVVTGQELETTDCPNLLSIERALVHLHRVIILGDQPVVCHVAE